MGNDDRMPSHLPRWNRSDPLDGSRWKRYRRRIQQINEKYDVIIWAHHGIFCSGEDFDNTFGLMHTIEKAAAILLKVLAVRPDKLQTITPDNFRHLAKDFNVNLPEEFLYEK